MTLRVLCGAAITAAVAVWLWVAGGTFSADHAFGIALAVAALMVAGVLVAKPTTALLLGTAFAVSVAVVWYAGYDTTASDSGPLDGIVLGLIALVSTVGAVGSGALVAQFFE